MDLNLADKVVLVTGAGSGIGRAVAVAFAAEGAQVVVADRDKAAGDGTVELIATAGGRAVFVPADIARPDAVDNMIGEVIRTFGRLDVAVNNAGITQPSVPLAETTDELFNRVIGVNLVGTFYCLRAEITAMLGTGGGAIVNVSSMSAFTGNEGLGAYNATKHAVLGLTRTAALETAQQGIRVNGVAPGTIETPMIQAFVDSSDDPDVMAPIRAAHPMGRTGTTDEVTGAVLYLASDRASFTTGHTLLVDGGYTAR